MSFHRCFLLALFTLMTPTLGWANWPSWRGPDANAVAPNGEYPVEFSPTKNVVWEVDLGGEGSSTPIVWDDAVFLTVTSDGSDVAVSYDLEGNERWRKVLGKARAGKHRNATGSNSSPVTDGNHVVVYFKSGLVVGLTTDGEEIWRVNLQDKYGEDTLWWDLGTSPVLTSAGVCIAVMQEGDSYLVTFDLESGDEVWKTKRQYERPRESDQAYTTPSVVEIDGRETIVTFGADHLTAHDAKTGELLWERDGFNPQDKGMWRVIASPTVASELAVIPYGRADFLAAVPLNHDAATTNGAARLWEKEGIGADVPCPIIAEGKVYLLSDRGEVTCLALESGDVLWQQKLPRGRENYFSSPLLADGKLYCLRQDGTLFVATADEEFTVLAENDLGDESVATPVPVEGSLLVRTRTKLYRFASLETRLDQPGRDDAETTLKEANVVPANNQQDRRLDLILDPPVQIGNTN